MVLAACGTRLSHEELLAADRQPGSAEAAQGPALGQEPAQPGDVPAGSPSADLSSTTLPPGSGTGSGDGGAVAPPSNAPAASACSRPGSPIILGTVGQLSGVVGAVFLPGVKAAQAWVSSVNARGGIACHPVQYIVADDGGDPSRQQALVRQMVEQKGVIGFLHMTAALTGQASLAYLTDRRIPVIGDGGAADWAYGSPMYFPQAATGLPAVEANYGAAGILAKLDKVPALGVISCLEATVCSGIFDVADQYSAKYGMQLKYKARVSLVQPDFTSQCQAAKSAGVQMLLVGADANTLTRMARSCNGVNFRPRFFALGSGISLALAKDPLLEGLGGGLIEAPWFATANAGVAEFQRTLAKYAPGLAPDPSAMSGWTSAKLFETAIKSVSESPTSGDLLEGLWAIRSNDLGGITAPLTFTREKPPDRSFCYWLVQIRDGKFTSPNEGQRTC